MKKITVKTGLAFAMHSQVGYTATVDGDGHVRVYDDIAGHYTLAHSLSDRQIAYIKKNAIEED